MNTPTPRTSAAIIASGFQAVPEGFRAFAGNLERELAALTAERDRLRGALALGQQNCDDAYDDLRDERDAAKARAKRAEASLHAATEECTDVRLKWHAVMGMCAAKEDSIMEADEELARLRAELAVEREKSERYRLASLKLDADLAAERARLDYLLRWDPTFNSREDIDRDMQEATK